MENHSLSGARRKLQHKVANKRKYKHKTKTGKSSRADWMPYEHRFWNLCQERRWKVELDEDGTPILLPGRSGDCWKVYVHGINDDGTLVCGVCIMAQIKATKTAALKKLRAANILQDDDKDLICDCETEAIVLFHEDRLPRAVKTLNLKKKRKNPLSRERQLEILEKARKARKKKNGN